MDSYIVGAMVTKLINQGGWKIDSLANKLNCTSELLDKCVRGIAVPRHRIAKIECELARIYCATAF